MGDWRQKVHTGQRVRDFAGLRNDTIDVVTAFKRGQNQQRSAGSRPFPEGLIYIQNNSGAVVPRFGVLGISGVAIDPTTNLPEFQDNAVLTGVTPATPTHTGKFVVAYESMPVGAICRAFVFGTCTVQVNIATAGDKFADIANADATQLKSGSTGVAQILYAPAGTGTKWCLVRLGAGGGGMFPVKLSAGAGSSGSNTTPAQAARTYTVKDLAGNTLGTGVSVTFARQYGHVADATNGIAYYDGSGALQIMACDEVIDGGLC